MKRNMMIAALLVVALAVPGIASAQVRGAGSVDAGSILVSGSSQLDLFGLTRSSFDDNTTMDYGLTLSALGGYFIIDGLAVGSLLRLTAKGVSMEWDGPTGANADNVDVNGTLVVFDLVPTVRYYFLPRSWFKPYVNGGVGVRVEYLDLHDSTDRGAVDELGVETLTSLFGFDVGGGVALFLVDNVSIDLGAGIDVFFGNRTIDPEPGSSDTEFGTEVGFTLGGAISAYF